MQSFIDIENNNLFSLKRGVFNLRFEYGEDIVDIDDSRVARNKELADKFESYLNMNGTKSFYENNYPNPN